MPKRKTFCCQISECTFAANNVKVFEEHRDHHYYGVWSCRISHPRVDTFSFSSKENLLMHITSEHPTCSICNRISACDPLAFSTVTGPGISKHRKIPQRAATFPDKLHMRHKEACRKQQVTIFFLSLLHFLSVSFEKIMKITIFFRS